MAYAPSDILTAIYQSCGAGVAADSTKETAVKKAITMAYVEASTILQAEDATKNQHNVLWYKLAMYRGTAVAVGWTEWAMQLFKEYHDYLDLLLEGRLPDTNTAEPSWT